MHLNIEFVEDETHILVPESYIFCSAVQFHQLHHERFTNYDLTYFIIFFKEKLGKVRTILSCDTRNKSNFSGFLGIGVRHLIF